MMIKYCLIEVQDRIGGDFYWRSGLTMGLMPMIMMSMLFQLYKLRLDVLYHSQNQN